MPTVVPRGVHANMKKLRPRRKISEAATLQNLQNQFTGIDNSKSSSSVFVLLYIANCFSGGGERSCRISLEGKHRSEFCHKHRGRSSDTSAGWGRISKYAQGQKRYPASEYLLAVSSESGAVARRGGAHMRQHEMGDWGSPATQSCATPEGGGERQ